MDDRGRTMVRRKLTQRFEVKQPAYIVGPVDTVLPRTVISMTPKSAHCFRLGVD